MSPSPAITRCAAIAIVWRPEEQKRLTVMPAVVTGQPARIAICRAMLRPVAPSGFAQPMITSSISAGSTPARAMACCSAWPPRSAPCVMLKAPRQLLQSGVRAVETITASGMLLNTVYNQRLMATALDDVLVLDLSHALAGPFASTMLGDYGAEIIKIEPPEGEISRAWGPPFYGDESAYFVNLNRNKKSVAIDLKQAEGRALFFRLLERADVVLENLRVGTVAKLGIDYEHARAVNPRIVYCSVSGFGQDGPYRDRAALDLVVQAESGMISVTGEAGGRGVRAGVSIADITAGMYAAFGILTALHAREKTGRGQFVDVSMLQGQLGILTGAIGAYVCDGIVPGPMGTAYGMLLPYQTFQTKTRDIAIGIGSDKLWRLFCPRLGLPDLVDDPRYVTNAARNANRATLIETLQRAFLT